MTKYICFRFDVDTHICLTKGVENILEVADQYGARCTFFINMGKAFNRSFFIREKLMGSLTPKKVKIGVFPMHIKLSLNDSLDAIVRNPKVGASHSNILKKIVASGHELGLHGGKNHAVWEHNAKKWGKNRVCREIEFGLNYFHQFNLPKPVSFASPCWQTPEGLAEIIHNKGFSILADQNTPQNNVMKDQFGLIHCPLNIVGKNNDVGFIENFRALNYSSDAILKEFERQLDIEGQYKMVFDHPFYVGTKELPVLSRMMEISIDKGYKIESLQKIISVI